MLIAHLTAALLFAAPAPAAAPAAPKPFTFVTEAEGLREYALPNGLRVVLVPDSSKPTVTVNLTLFVGSRHEAGGEGGMAHLLEHLLFKGTPKTPDAKQAISDHGADANGTTWFDRTNYYESMPASDANTEWAIRFEADRMVNAFIAKKDLDSEMTVVRNEFEMGESDPSNVLNERVMAAAFQWHNYAHSTIGPKSDIEQVPIARLQSFYKRYYQPDNAMLVIAGKYDEAKVFKWIADSFGKIPRPKDRQWPTYTIEPAQDGERAVFVRRAGGVPTLMAGWHVPAGTDPEFAAIDVLTQVLGDAPSGRLHTALVESKKAAHVGCSNYQLKDPGYLYCQVELKPGDNVDAARSTLLSISEGLGAKPVTREQTERAKATLLKQLELVLNSSERIGLILSECAAMGDWRMLFVHRDRLKAVTTEDVNKAAAKYLIASNRTLGEYVPTPKPARVEIPAAGDVAAMLKDFKGSAALSVGEVFDASPKNIEARTSKGQLANGMKWALLPKKTRGETVQVALTIHYGNLASLTHQRTAVELTSKMLTRGTKKRSRQAFKDALDRLNAQIHVQAGAQGVVVTAEVRKVALLETLDLLAEALTEPAFDNNEFEQLRRESLAQQEALKSEPTQIGFLELRRAVEPWPVGHPFAIQTPDEAIAGLTKIKREDLVAFHSRHYGTQSAEVALVGDFDSDVVKPKLEALLGGWKAPQPFVRIPRPHKSGTGTTVTLPLPDKANAFYGVGLDFALNDADPEYPAMIMADYLLGGGFMSGRITKRLRESEGLSYGAGTYLRVPPLEDAAAMYGYAIFAPQNLEKVERGMNEELKKAVDSGFTDKEVKDARPGLLQAREQSRAEDNSLAMMLSGNLYLGRTLAFEEALDEKLKALTAAQVSAATKKHLNPSKLTGVKAGDFKALPAAN
ncbi:MAG: Zinc protease [Myxococcaceae bacterium]|nr:Zinc protease [Myxococcaceae bacterium]